MVEHSGNGKPYLGSLCPRQHSWQNSSKSLKDKKKRYCVDCRRDIGNRRRSQKPGYKPVVAREEQRLLTKDLLTQVFKQKSVGIPRDIEKYYLGVPCSYGHDYEGTGYSLRALNSGGCLDCANRLSKNYRAARPGLASASYKQYRLENPEREKIRQAKYNQKNAEKVSQNRRRYYRENGDRERQNHIIWCRQNPEKNRLHNTKRRGLQRSAHHVPYTELQLNERLQQFNGLCAYCCQTPKHSWDHFLPLSVGGSDNIDNILPACQFCNTSKLHRDPSIWYKRQPFYKRSRWLKILKVLGKTEQNYNQIPLL